MPYDFVLPDLGEGITERRYTELSYRSNEGIKHRRVKGAFGYLILFPQVNPCIKSA